MKKFLRAATAAVLAASLVGCSVNAEDDSSADNTKDNKTEETSSSKSLSYSSDQTGKEETVYIFTDANGNENRQIVSDKLHVAGKTGAVKDYSELKDIINVSGDETFTQDANGNITWQSEGGDISYQGTSDKRLPVSVKVTYYLNDKEVSADEISGASGHVKIRYDYTNNADEKVTVNGQEETVKVPFAMVTGLILPSSFSNISVTNGRLIQYEDDSIIYGIAFPGLKDSLNLDSYDVDLKGHDIPEYVEIEGDTTDFGINMAMTYASSNLLNNLISGDDLDLSDLSGSADDLDDAAKQLIDGTTTLKNGTSQLKDGASTLQSGADQLAAGAQSAYSGASALSNGLGQLSGNSASLNNGAAQIAQGILDSANQQLKQNDMTKNLPELTLENYATVLGSVIGKDKLRAAALQQVEAAVSAQMPGVSEDTIKALIYMAAIHSTGNFTNDLTAQGARAQQAQAIQSATAGYTDKASALKSAKVQAVLNAYKQQLVDGNVPNAGDEQMAQVYAEIAAGVRKEANGQLDKLNDDQVNAIVAYALSNSSSSNVSTQAIKSALGQLLPALQNPQQAQAILATDYRNNAAYKAFANAQYAAAYRQQVSAMDASALYDQIASAITKQTGISDEASIAKLIGYTCDHYDQSRSLTEQLTANGAALNDAVTVANEIANASTEAGQEKINGALDVQINSNASVSAGLQQLNALEASLDGVSAFVEGLKAYTAGVDSAYAGSKQLVNGLGTLNSGAAQLSAGTKTLYDGIVQLDDGAGTLMDGMQKFYDEGIKKITDLLGGDMSDALDRLKAVVNSGTGYDTYGGALDDSSNTVRFIFKLDTVNADSNN